MFLFRIENYEIYQIMSVAGDMDISYTFIKELPNGLVVGGNLNVENTQLTSLPPNLTVVGKLLTKNTQII